MEEQVFFGLISDSVFFQKLFESANDPYMFAGSYKRA